MSHSPRHFTVTDPRSFDGTPYEVAERAVAQIEGLLTVVAETLPATQKMVVNAELSRQLVLGQEPDPKNSVLRRKMNSLSDTIEDARSELRVIQRAAGYDPKNPPR